MIVNSVSANPTDRNQSADGGLVGEGRVVRVVKVVTIPLDPNNWAIHHTY